MRSGIVLLEVSKAPEYLQEFSICTGAILKPGLRIISCYCSMEPRHFFMGSGGNELLQLRPLADDGLLQTCSLQAQISYDESTHIVSRPCLSSQISGHMHRKDAVDSPKKHFFFISTVYFVMQPMGRGFSDNYTEVTQIRTSLVCMWAVEAL